MQTLTLASLALVAVTACADRAPQIITLPAPDATEHRGMAVQGQATLDVSPDCADMTITIGADDLKPGTAAKMLEQKRLALVAALQKAGVAITDVTMSNLELQPIFEITDKGFTTRKLIDYRASIVVTATTRDFVRIPEMLDAAAGSGSTQISTKFRRSDLSALKAKVRDMALTAAKAKAEQTAKTLGIKLGRIMSVAENAGGYMWSQEYFPSNVQAVQTNGDTSTVGGALQPLTLNVTIDYELATT